MMLVMQGILHDEWMPWDVAVMAHMSWKCRRVEITGVPLHA